MEGDNITSGGVGMIGGFSSIGGSQGWITRNGGSGDGINQEAWED